MTEIDPNINQQFWSNVNRIATQPSGLTPVTPKFTHPSPITINVPYPILANNPNNTGYGHGLPPSTGAPLTGTDSLTRLMNAIRSQESGGSYSAVNKDSGALGAYQVMPSNIPSWTKLALGRSVSTNEYLHNQQEQDAVAKYMLGKYLSQYGVAGAAAAWYGGPGAVKNMYSKTPYGGYPSMYDYVQSILRKYGAG